MSTLAMLGGTRSVPRNRRMGQWPRVTPEDEAAIGRVVAGGRFTSASAGEQEIGALEREWADFVGTAHCVAVSNGTTALSVALAAAGIGPGDEVIVPALSFIATALAPLHLAAVPRFVDVDPVTYNMTPAAVEAAVTPRTRAVVVVHLHGLPADLAELRAVADRHGLVLVEDAAQAHGARYRGRRVGSAGAVSSFSLNVSKNLATCGEGGLVNTDDPDLHRRALMLRQFGELIPDGGERSYVSHLPGWNAKPNAIQCAFTRSQLARLPAEDEQRDRAVRRLLGRLGQLPGLLVPSAPADRSHAWHILRFRVDATAFGLEPARSGAARAVVMRALRAEGVPASHYQLMPLPAQRVFRAPPGVGIAPYRAGDFPDTLAVIDTSFTIQKAHLHPDAGPLLDLYADAIEKVWEQRDVVAAHAAALEHRTPWAEAEAIADAELQPVEAASATA